MPNPIGPGGEYGGRCLNGPSSLRDNERYGVIVPPVNGQSAARLYVFSDREKWQRYCRDMAMRGHPWFEFLPIVFQPVQMGVVMVSAPEAERAVLETAGEVLNPIDSRIELLTGDD